MIAQTQTLLRAAQQEDQQQIAYLIHFEVHVHRHLDYRPPLDWIGQQPFLVLEDGREIRAALACPPDPEQVAWVRLFASANELSYEYTWDNLWPSAYEQLTSKNNNMLTVAAIPLHEWFERLLIRNRFQQTHEITMLKWEKDNPIMHHNHSRALIRPMSIDDLQVVQQIDAAAFVPIWQNSLTCLDYAFRQAVIATVAEVDGALAGYQISTPTPLGGHLARLAVHPDQQGIGIGRTLLNDLLEQFKQRNAQAVTVNTQKNNQASLALYKAAGFKYTGEEFPIYEIDLPRT